MAQRVDQLVTRELQSAGVWTPWYAVLSMIAIQEPITPTALARAMGVAPATLSDRLGELLERGHVERGIPARRSGGAPGLASFA